MANTTTTNLPSVTSLNGSEEVAVVQGGISARTTTQAIADLNANGGTVTSITADAPLSGGTITTTGTIGLNNDGVTNTYLAPMAAFTIKGNNTSGSTNPQDLTASQARSAMGAAPLASPAFTGTPTAPTPTSLDNSTKIATTASSRLSHTAQDLSHLSRQARVLRVGQSQQRAQLHSQQQVSLHQHTAQQPFCRKLRLIHMAA